MRPGGDMQKMQSSGILQLYSLHRARIIADESSPAWIK
jgi:hypothetical protein